MCNSDAMVKTVFLSGISCGIKANGDHDLGYIYVPKCVGSAVVLSQNQIRSATLNHNERVFGQGPVELVVVNSGNANSATGPLGVQHVDQTVQKAAEVFGCPASRVAVASTGIIGVPLPIDSVLNGLQTMNPRDVNIDAFSTAILTTDLTKKVAKRSLSIGGTTVQFLGVTKGSGMIAPNMATTLGFIVTDLALSSSDCHEYLRHAIDASYNMISVDTDCSTNDMVSLQSSGYYNLDLSVAERREVQATLTDLCIDLAQQIVRDGEGATHMIEVEVTGAQMVSHAKQIAKSVVDSPLVKTAISGNNPNWGRLLMAVGKVPPTIPIQPACVSIQINDVMVFNGVACPVDSEALRRSMAEHTIRIHIQVGDGDGCAVAWGCDLTKDYVRINAEYN